jgi:hypothetical protein
MTWILSYAPQPVKVAREIREQDNRARVLSFIRSLMRKFFVRGRFVGCLSFYLRLGLP